MFYILARKAIGDIGNLRKILACVLRIDLKWVYIPECTKRLIIGIIQMVTEADESHLLSGLEVHTTSKNCTG